VVPAVFVTLWLDNVNHFSNILQEGFTPMHINNSLNVAKLIVTITNQKGAAKNLSGYGPTIFSTCRKKIHYICSEKGVSFIS
jgi:hypothetical protein